MAITQTGTGGIKDDAVTTDKLANAINTERTANTAKVSLADNAVTLAKMAGGTDGQIITYDASGDPVAVGPGTDGQVLTSTGAGSPPAFETPAPGVGGATGVDFNDDTKARFGGSNQLELYYGSSVGNLKTTSGALELGSAGNATIKIAGTESAIVCEANGAVKIYHNNVKTCQTEAGGVWNVRGATDNNATLMLSANDGGDNGDSWRLLAEGETNTKKLTLTNNPDGNWETSLTATGNAGVELYYNNTKQCETASNGLAFPASKGISFTGQTATSASGTSNQDTDEIISAYEFGDWTPTCTNTALASGGGHYSKIGHFVYISCNMTFGSMSGGGTVTLGGLPFATGSGTYGGIMVKYSNFSTLGDIMGHLDAGAATLHLPGTTLDEASGKRLDWSTVYTTYDF